MRTLNIGDGHPGAAAGTVRCASKQEMLKKKEGFVESDLQALGFSTIGASFTVMILELKRRKGFSSDKRPQAHFGGQVGFRSWGPS